MLKDEMIFFPYKSLKFKTLSFKNDRCIGSYTIGKETIISQFEVKSKYSLFVVKLRNVSNNFKFKDHVSNNYSTPGYFSTINEGLYEVNLNPGIFEDNYKISQIDFFSDSAIEYQINNDTIKSFNVDFNKYVIKINNQESKVIYSQIEYYGLKSLKANFLIYKEDQKIYLFIMTPKKENIILEKNTLYEHLFDKNK
ncbi:hypothetical protein IRZ71_07090 [Flavobacterium sp. ANB]|uniref:hypothetical protein n=1 Tax=unclassified Flavobacterium TaxID=196869 RepID=UPI0012B6B19C|nr:MULTISPECIES: hypothetical protein [unclassified Flavobacterium]MBF4516100.1 hypothetical protein [Flavobacterium sp. ANB]MTD72197.1 hypothetical protein [Flavobacterium sp. LC2016-13]